MTDWDPATSYSNEIIAMNNMYETLTRYDTQTKKVEPLLADVVQVEQGGHDLDVHAAPGREVPHRPRR